MLYSWSGIVEVQRLRKSGPFCSNSVCFSASVTCSQMIATSLITSGCTLAATNNCNTDTTLLQGATLRTSSRVYFLFSSFCFSSNLLAGENFKISAPDLPFLLLLLLSLLCLLSMRSERICFRKKPNCC